MAGHCFKPHSIINVLNYFVKTLLFLLIVLFSTYHIYLCDKALVNIFKSTISTQRFGLSLRVVFFKEATTAATEKGDEHRQPCWRLREAGLKHNGAFAQLILSLSWSETKVAARSDISHTSWSSTSTRQSCSSFQGKHLLSVTSPLKLKSLWCLGLSDTWVWHWTKSCCKHCCDYPLLHICDT